MWHILDRRSEDYSDTAEQIKEFEFHGGLDQVSIERSSKDPRTEVIEWRRDLQIGRSEEVSSG